jgi:hypothetical protein
MEALKMVHSGLSEDGSRPASARRQAWEDSLAGRQHIIWQGRQTLGQIFTPQVLLSTKTSRVPQPVLFFFFVLKISTHRLLPPDHIGSRKQRSAE